MKSYSYNEIERMRASREISEQGNKSMGYAFAFIVALTILAIIQ